MIPSEMQHRAVHCYHPVAGVAVTLDIRCNASNDALVVVGPALTQSPLEFPVELGLYESVAGMQTMVGVGRRR